jgi:hypothetical protein
MPDTFAIAPNNLLLDANGINAVFAWDGNAPQAFPAGCPAPATAPTIAADTNGIGTITGVYNAYVRFYDSRGNFSSFSPISNQIVAANATTITYTNVPIPADPAVIGKQILRNAAGEFLTFYVDVDTPNLAGTTFTSTTIDTTLQNQQAQALFDTNGNSLADQYGLPPDWKPIISQHQTRMWLAGEQPYGEGAAIVTSGALTVKGIGTNWPTNFAGRFFYGNGAYAGIQIASVAGQVLALVSPWLGSSDPYLYYTIKPAPAEKNILYFSLPGLPEAYDPLDALEVPEDGFNITGLMPMSSFLYIVKELRIYRLTDQGDPVNDGFIFESARRGCVNNRCWATVGTDAYLLDYYGIYKFSGGQTEDLSVPIQGVFRGTNRYYRLNWDQSRYWHAVADANYQTIRFFVTLGGDYLPKSALCYNYILKRWWIEQYPWAVSCSAIAPATSPSGGWRSVGQERLYVGGPAAGVFTLAPTANLDGPNPAAGTCRGFVTSSTICGLTCNTASFASSGLIGSYATIVEGTGQGQSRLITDVSGQTLAVSQPWTTSLDATSVFQIGAVYYEFKTGRMTFADSESRQTRKIQLGFRPCPSQQEAIAQLYDDYSEKPTIQQHSYTSAQRRGVSSQAADPRQRIDLTRKYGAADINIDAQRERDTDSPRRIAYFIYGWNRENPLTFKALAETGVVAKQ